MKRIFFLCLVTLIVFIIYLSTVDRKVYYVSLTSKSNIYNKYLIDTLESRNMLEKSLLEFNNDNYRVIDFINMIKNNESIKINNKKQNIRNGLIKADILLIEVGLEDLNNCKTIKDIDNIIYNVDEYFEIIREYCKEDILVMPIYSNDIDYKLLQNYNDKLKKVSDKYQMHYIDSSEKELLNNIKKNMITYFFE